MSVHISWSFTTEVYRVVASGTLSKIIDNLRNIVAASSTFQTWTGNADDAAAAKEEVHIEQADPSSNRPLAVVGYDDGPEEEAHASGARNYFELRGRLWLEFEGAITEEDPVNALYEFTNTIGAIIAEMEVLAASGGYLNITSINLDGGPARSRGGEKGAEGDYYRAIYTVGIWGAGA